MTIEELRVELFRFANSNFEDKYGVSALERALECLAAFIDDIDCTLAIREISEISQGIAVAMDKDNYQKGYDEGYEEGEEEGYAKAMEELQK